VRSLYVRLKNVLDYSNLKELDHISHMRCVDIHCALSNFVCFTSQVDFGLPINIDDMIDELDEDGSGEIEWPEFKKLFTRPTETPDFNPKDLADVTSGAHGITDA